MGKSTLTGLPDPRSEVTRSMCGMKKPHGHILVLQFQEKNDIKGDGSLKWPICQNVCANRWTYQFPLANVGKSHSS